MKNNKQQGIVLVISLIILLLMTIIGLFAMRTSAMEEKMAGNSRDRQLAFQASETALTDTEKWLFDQPMAPLIAMNNNGRRVWSHNDIDPNNDNAENWWQELERNDAWWQNAANAKKYSGDIKTVKTQPASVIEYRQFIPDTLLVGNGYNQSGLTYYQVTARGTGGSDQAKVLLQSTYARSF